MNEHKHVIIDYTNYRGERSEREILPFHETLRFAESPWHPGAQWIIDAHDEAKGGTRTFAMKDIHSWRPAR